VATYLDLGDWSADNCSVARALAAIGDKWTLLLLRDAFLGVRRFDEFHHRLGAPRQVLSDRLGKLVEDGLLYRVPYKEPGQRPRQEYRLTGAGFDLYPVLVALLEWGDKYRADPEGPALDLRHRDCEAPVSMQLRCEEGHTLSSAREVTPRPGPGAHRRTA
jgi:DNA-binding HxlR family transcriptional regulator